MRAALLLAAVLVALLGPAAAIDNGLGLTPPMGCESCALFSIVAKEERCRGGLEEGDDGRTGEARGR